MKNLIFYIAAIVLITLGSCNQDQEVADIIDPTQKSLITITTENDLSSLKEGDTLTFSVEASKQLTGNVGFGTRALEENVEEEGVDFITNPGTLFAYSNTTEVEVVVAIDNIPQMSQRMALEVGAFALGQNWQISPESDIITINVDVENVNSPDALTLAFGWVDPDHVTDFDLAIEAETLGSWSTSATSDNPEINMDVWPIDPDDTFLVGVDPYDVPNDVNEIIMSVGHPDGTVEIFEGVFDMTKLDDYDTFIYTNWGVPVFLVLTVEKTGENFDVTFASGY